MSLLSFILIEMMIRQKKEKNTCLSVHIDNMDSHRSFSKNPKNYSKGNIWNLTNKKCHKILPFQDIHEIPKLVSPLLREDLEQFWSRLFTKRIQDGNSHCASGANPNCNWNANLSFVCYPIFTSCKLIRTYTITQPQKSFEGRSRRFWSGSENLG